MSHPSDNYSPEQLWHVLNKLRDGMVNPHLIDFEIRRVNLERVNYLQKALGREPLKSIDCHICGEEALYSISCYVGYVTVCEEHRKYEYLDQIFTVDMLIQNYSGE